MGESNSAWCPGGRTAQKTLLALLCVTSLTPAKPIPQHEGRQTGLRGPSWYPDPKGEPLRRNRLPESVDQLGVMSQSNQVFIDRLSLKQRIILRETGLLNALAGTISGPTVPDVLRGFHDSRSLDGYRDARFLSPARFAGLFYRQWQPEASNKTSPRDAGLFVNGGEGGIRTLDTLLTYSLSRGAPSATRPLLQILLIAFLPNFLLLPPIASHSAQRITLLVTVSPLIPVCPTGKDRR